MENFDAKMAKEIADKAADENEIKFQEKMAKLDKNLEKDIQRMTNDVLRLVEKTAKAGKYLVVYKWNSGLFYDEVKELYNYKLAAELKAHLTKRYGFWVEHRAFSFLGYYSLGVNWKEQH